MLQERLKSDPEGISQISFLVIGTTQAGVGKAKEPGLFPSRPIALSMTRSGNLEKVE